jgi:hypothetical protein
MPLAPRWPASLTGFRCERLRIRRCNPLEQPAYPHRRTGSRGDGRVSIPVLQMTPVRTPPPSDRQGSCTALAPDALHEHRRASHANHVKQGAIRQAPTTNGCVRPSPPAGCHRTVPRRPERPPSSVLHGFPHQELVCPTWPTWPMWRMAGWSSRFWSMGGFPMLARSSDVADMANMADTASMGSTAGHRR